MDQQTQLEAPQVKIPPANEILKAYKQGQGVIFHTPLIQSNYLSEKYQANIFLKREDMQVVRSFKLRGAFNQIMSLKPEDLQNGVCTASAGNHAQGVAFVCKTLKCKGTIFMPVSSPSIQVRSVKYFGGEYVDTVLVGDTFDQAASAANEFSQQNSCVYIPAYDDMEVIIGQGTIAVQVLMDMAQPLDYLFCCVGGGGLCSGMSSYFSQMSPETKVVGCEPLGCPSMQRSLDENQHVVLTKINTFVDGAAVGRPGLLTMGILKQTLKEHINLVSEGAVCTALLELYNQEGIVCEPAGALSIAGLEKYADKIIGKTVVCTVSGNNNDLTRMNDIRTYSRTYEGTTKYLLINFYQKPGAFKKFLLEGVHQDDEIITIEYTQKFQSEKGPALVGIDFQNQDNFKNVEKYMNENQIQFNVLQPGTELFMTLL